MSGGDVIRAGRVQLVEVYPPLADLLAEVEAGMRGVWEGEEGFLGMAARRALSGRGKRLRPGVLLLAAECAGGATEISAALGTVVEVLHTASLVHDDVVDGSAARRGKRSANAEWGNKVSVLLGDYLLARALELLPTEERERFLPELLAVARRMCAGQVEELRSAGRRLTEGEYLEIAREKTGRLFGFCGRAGAVTGGGSREAAEALEGFAERFGVAFQLADDILDLVGSDGRSGKPEGRDLAEGKLTLPLILAAERASSGEWARVEEMVAREEVSEEEVGMARELAESTGAIEVAWGRVAEWLEAAREQLRVAPESEAKAAAMALAGERFPMPVMG